MLLAIDIGNSNIVLGLFSTPNNTLSGPTELLHTARIKSNSEKTADEYSWQIAAFLAQATTKISVANVTICSVVPNLSKTISTAILAVFNDPLPAQ